MFTGIITAVGNVRAMDMRTDLADQTGQEIAAFTLTLPYADLTLGESVAVNGVCLTVAALEPIGRDGTHAKFFVSQETCARTNLGQLSTGDAVNLERAVRLSDRLSGHLVQGHVDDVGVVTAIRPAGESRELIVDLPTALGRYVIEKGSIALDGISLTINAIECAGDRTSISLMIVPHTWEHTNLKSSRVGAMINTEVDVLAKYVERALTASSQYSEKLGVPHAHHT